MKVELIKTYLNFDRQRKKLELQVKDLKEKLAKLMPKVEEELLQAGVDSLKLDGASVGTRSQLWAKPKNGDYEKACEALRKAGLDDFVRERFNTNTLSAYVRELRDNDQPLPESFVGVIEVSEVTKVITREVG